MAGGVAGTGFLLGRRLGFLVDELHDAPGESNELRRQRFFFQPDIRARDDVDNAEIIGKLHDLRLGGSGGAGEDIDANALFRELAGNI